jgi:hypothetical protein
MRLLSFFCVIDGPLFLKDMRLRILVCPEVPCPEGKNNALVFEYFQSILLFYSSLLNYKKLCPTRN